MLRTFDGQSFHLITYDNSNCLPLQKKHQIYNENNNQINNLKYYFYFLADYKVKV